MVFELGFRRENNNNKKINMVRNMLMVLSLLIYDFTGRRTRYLINILTFDDMIYYII